jgi:hypothetical protein
VTLRRLWRRWRALQVLGRHERWRVAMGCPGVPYLAGGYDCLPRSVPREGEVYCRCPACHDARDVLGWPPLRPLPPAPQRPSPIRGER